MNTGRPTLLQHKINQLRDRQTAIAEEIERIAASQNAELKLISEELAVLENAAAILDGKPGGVAAEVRATVKTIDRSPNGRTDWSRFDASSIRGITKQQALEKMARWAGGTIKMKEIGQVLINGGQSSQKHPAQASAQAYGSVAQSRLFRKTGVGEYTLIQK